MTERVVVVGGGMAAVRLAEQLVGADVSPSPSSPTSRTRRTTASCSPPSSRAPTPPTPSTLRSPAWFAAHGIDLRLGTRVARDRPRGARGRAGRRGTAGLRPARPGDRSDPHPAADPRPGPPRRHPPPEGPPVPQPRGLPPARRARWSRCGAAASRPRAVVVGGGLLGLQVARALSVRGVLTEVVEGADHLLASQVGPAGGGVLARDLRRLGTEVYTGARAVRMTDDGVQLDNGAIAADRPRRAHRRRSAVDRAGPPRRPDGPPRDRRRQHPGQRHRRPDPRHRRLRRAPPAYDRLRPARLGAGRGARAGAARARRRRTTATAASRACARPASTSPCWATRRPPTARSSR